MNPDFVNHAPEHLRAARQELQEAIELTDESSAGAERLEDIETEILELEQELRGINYD
jgi:hypothetical protein